MEVDAESVRVILADKKDGAELRILGRGEARLQGFRDGKITHAGDLVESIGEAADHAQRAAGLRIEKLFYNFNDEKIESVWPAGSKILDGEGEIQASDVRAAAGAAERLAGNFEKKIIYSAEVDYVIDDKDPVANPVGIFGHKLDVKTHLLLVRADWSDRWSRLLARAGFSRTTPVLSGLSSTHAVLSREERRETKIVWDLSKAYCNGLVISGGRILEYRTFLTSPEELESVSAVCVEFRKKHPAVSEAIFTGSLLKEGDLFAKIQAALALPVRTAAPSVAGLAETGFSSIAGLLQVASDIEKRSTAVRPEKKTLGHAREKVRAFLSDYF